MKNLIILNLLIISFLYGKALIPQENIDLEELNINGNSRDYHLLDKNSYMVSGPSVVTIYARLAVPKKEKGIHSFSVISFLSGMSESVNTFHKKIDSSVSSLLHPMHRYTKSGKIEIKIPEGDFLLILDKKSNFRSPILARVIEKKDKE